MHKRCRAKLLFKSMSCTIKLLNLELCVPTLKYRLSMLRIGGVWRVWGCCLLTSKHYSRFWHSWIDCILSLLIYCMTCICEEYPYNSLNGWLWLTCLSLKLEIVLPKSLQFCYGQEGCPFSLLKGDKEENNIILERAWTKVIRSFQFSVVNTFKQNIKWERQRNTCKEEVSLLPITEHLLYPHIQVCCYNKITVAINVYTSNSISLCMHY